MKLVMRLAPPASLTRWRRAWTRLKRPLERASLAALTLLLAFCVWPYTTLWRLDRALLDGDPGAFSRLVDLEAVREQIGRRLNMDRQSDIGPLSDTFILWVESGLHQTGPDRFLDREVTFDWMRDRLNACAPAERGILSALTYAFFEGPLDFDVRIGAKDADPVMMRMHLQGLGWRVVMLYY